MRLRDPSPAAIGLVTTVLAGLLLVGRVYGLPQPTPELFPPTASYG